jgi:hypothetical protein
VSERNGGFGIAIENEIEHVTEAANSNVMKGRGAEACDGCAAINPRLNL